MIFERFLEMRLPQQKFTFAGAAPRWSWYDRTPDARIHLSREKLAKIFQNTQLGIFL